MRYKVVDFHCDALCKMQLDPKLDFGQDRKLDVSLKTMTQGGVMLQCFAIFVSQSLGKPQIGHILEQIDIFHQKVVTKGISPIRTAEDIVSLEQTGGRGGILSIEGADGLEANMFYVRLCYERGVRFLGLTWNFSNWAADGIMEVRNGGFTPQGVELVKVCNELGITLDVSHLSQKGFWELVELATESGRPFIASHSNAYQVCAHARNLRNEQIKAIISLDGRIGLTFVPWFVKEGKHPSSKDLLLHIEHICSLGGEHTLMFGSDFDGIETYLSDLKHSGDYARWVETLLIHYPENLVRQWLYGNAVSFLKIWLP
ncbi:membrane dipeptidase [Paenibacillus anaericanus]|uniref:dipeptidase n=1 Tax=Paenibacillus anaericanus TaxID=170367 RepID=UPI00277F17BE|nr:membrane dipeptidase [Paenibacillus anaericanus]MDQ0090543.1 membrane dipeptidase [Paenibacillus anaericanus]